MLIKQYIERGYSVVHEGITAGIRKVVFLDTLDDFGVYIEFQQTHKKRIKK